MKLTQKIEREVKKMKDHSGKKGGINPVVAGAAGLAVGAGVAAALSDKKTQEKLGKIMGDIRSRVSEYMEKEHVVPEAKSKVRVAEKAVKAAGKLSER
jgi:hypothetical protein